MRNFRKVFILCAIQFSFLGNLYCQVDQETINAIVEKSIRVGINFVDTAPFYGQGESEKKLGIGLKKIPRNTFYIATKVVS